MLKIVRLVGESLDLETGESSPAGIIVSNNIAEVFIALARKEDIQAVINLANEAGVRGAATPKPATPAHVHSPQPPPSRAPTLVSSPFTEDEEEQEDEAGEEYNDPASGVASA
jgi:hypothetical protein